MKKVIVPVPRNLFAALTLALVSLYSHSSLAQAPPSADAYVTSTQPSANFGNSILLPVQVGTTSYIRLNLAALPANASIAKATLRLYVNAVAAPGSFDIYQIDTGWSERGLTFLRAPSPGRSATGGRSVPVTVASLNQFLLIDITPLVQGWLSGTIPNYGLALALSGSTGSFSFDSKESTGTAHQPELEVVFGDSTGTMAPGAMSKTALSSITQPITPVPPDPYIDNGTAPQVGGNFNIDGNGTAATFNASLYKLAGAPVLGNSGTQGIFLGAGAGQNNTGSFNTFLGVSAGQSNTTANYNTFIGYAAGKNNTTGTPVTFIGMNAGYHNTTGNQNFFLGVNAGYANTTGSNNVFIGNQAGYSTTTGRRNTFVGVSSGNTITTGTDNIFLGNGAGTAVGATSSNDIYIANLGVAADNGVIRIGTPANQTSAYIAGINGAATSSGVPVFIDSTGKLGTVGGSLGAVTSFNGRTGVVLSASNDYDFSQISGVASTTQVPTNLSTYIQNGSAPQTGTSFNIDGNGTLGGILNSNSVNSTTNYQIGGGVVLSVGGAADQNVFLGSGAGASNTPDSGQANSFSGFNAGLQNTVGKNNTFNGAAAGQLNTTGSQNTFLGHLAGANVTVGNDNIDIGENAGPAGDESNTTRIGGSNQVATYIAGINEAATNSGVPVFVDSTGKLGTSGGAINFSQVVGTLTSPQFSGTYNSSVTLSNSGNSFAGSFAGNGSGLTGVSSGLSWPIVPKSANYAISISDFSTPTSYGNFIVLTGTMSRTFTLPNPPPPTNGSCVAIGNVADAGINSGINVFLSVNPNGLNVDASVTFPTQPRRVAYLYCSDGTGYYRLGYNQNGVSEIGPWLYTVDTGTVNALKTTFRNGMDFGLNTGSMIYLLPVNNNTSGIPTLNVNGLGAKKILKFGVQPLAPNDLTTTALAHLVYDGNFWQLLNPQTAQGTVTAVTASAPLAVTGLPANPAISITGAAGQVLAGSGPAFTANPTLGVPGSALGTLSFAGNSSGAITMKPQPAAGTWEWDWPITAGAPGQVLTSQGGAGSPMTWAPISGLNDPGANGVVFRSSPGVTQAIAGVANQVLVAGPTPAYIDFPDVKYFAAASCNGGTPVAKWSLGAEVTAACRIGANNAGGYVAITNTSASVAQFQVEVPMDWDTASFPYIRFHLASTDGTAGDTIIPQVAVACLAGDGSTTDDSPFQTAHTASATTLNGTVNSFWNTSTLQLNSTDMSNCAGGSSMIVQIGRAADTATNAEFYGATITFPRLLAVQAN